MKINIKATNIELTENLQSYIEEKINSLNKYFNNIIEINVEVGQESTHHHKGKIFFTEINIKVPHELIRIKKTAEKQFKSVDKAKDHLKEMLIRYKEKLRSNNNIYSLPKKSNIS